MNSQFLPDLTNLLSRLKNSSGHFIIECEEYYCQLVKIDGEKTIRFEALSHHFNEKVAKGLQTKFETIGFSLEQDENYAKDIILNSDADLTNTAKEIEYIFEQIYEVPGGSKFMFDDQIDAASPQNPPSVVTTPKNQLNTTYKDADVLKALMIMGGLGLLVYFLWFNDDEKVSTKSNTTSYFTTVYNNRSERSLLSSVDEFKTNFNSFSNELDFSYRIKKIHVKKGVNNSFKYCFNRNLCIVGALNSSDNSLYAAYLIGNGDGSLQSGANILVAMGVLISTVDPTLTAEDRRQITKELGLWDDGADLYNLSNSVYKNGIKFSIDSSPQTGITFGAEVVH